MTIEIGIVKHPEDGKDYASIYMNGGDLLALLPWEVQEMIEEKINDKEVLQEFSKNHLVYIGVGHTQKIKPEQTQELGDSVMGRTFEEPSDNDNKRT